MVHEADIPKRRLEAQYELSRILAEATELATAAPRLLEVVGTRLDCVVSELWIVDRQKRELRFAGAWVAPGLDMELFERSAETKAFHPGEGLPGRVYAAGTPQWVRDLPNDPQFRRRDEAAKLGLRTAIAFPTRFAGETTGVIQFFDREDREPNRALIEVFADVGSLIGLFLERIAMANVVHKQSDELLQLSTPVLRVWNGVLLAPMIGSLDEGRAVVAMDRIVATVVETGARVVLVDVTGLPHLDTSITRFLLDTIRATRLVGARVILTGVRAPLAQTLVRLGVEVDEVTSAGTLADGLRMALAMSQAHAD